MQSNISERVSLMQESNRLTESQLLSEIDRLANRVEELELALINRASHLELSRVAQASRHRARPSLIRFIRLALFPIIAGAFRRIYDFAYKKKD